MFVLLINRHEVIFFKEKLNENIVMTEENSVQPCVNRMAGVSKCDKVFLDFVI